MDEVDDIDAFSDSGDAYEDAGIAEGCIDLDTAAPTKPEGSTSSQDVAGDRWEKTDTVWRWYRTKPKSGLVNPNRPKLPTGPDGYKDLSGHRRTLATVEGEDGKVQLYSGRVITAAGQKLLDQVAHNVREQANEAYPGLDKY